MSPIDTSGVYRHNDQAARAHGGMKEPKLGEPKEHEPKEPSESGNMTEVHNHGDGSFHTVHEGKQEEHETIGHMHAHLSSLHGSEGEKHFHAHHDGMSAHSHSGATGEEPEHRDHDPNDTEGMKEHLGESMGEEHEMGDQDSEENTAGSLAGGSALGM